MVLLHLIGVFFGVIGGLGDVGVVGVIDIDGRVDVVGVAGVSNIGDCVCSNLFGGFNVFVKFVSDV